MHVSTTTTAVLTDEEVRAAIAEYASKYRAGDFVFDPQTVTIFSENGSVAITVDAKVKTKPE